MPDYDYKRLRDDLEDFFLMIRANGSQIATAALADVESASENELVELARIYNFNLEDYLIE